MSGFMAGAYTEDAFVRRRRMGSPAAAGDVKYYERLLCGFH